MRYTIGFQDIDKSKLALVGGKGANLGELSRIEGIRVPPGFCITTDAYQEITGSSTQFNLLLDQLSILTIDDKKAIGEMCSEIRKVIEAITIPKTIEEEIARYVEQLGDSNAYAVRSSATAEDLPNASFAGQQDTYLNMIGKEAILRHVSKCWASLFTERAAIYRIQNGFDHRKVHLAVVIQKMVFSKVAGILFTADPVNGNRKMTSIDASFGLGETLVSGIVNPDIYKVLGGKIADKKISAKKLAVYALKTGGTIEEEIEPGQQVAHALSDEQILELDQIGRKIEKHFGSPQDIEWCLMEDEFYVVQSRPITTLFPIPRVGDEGNADRDPHVYVSVGHQQMMTDAMKPLGLSFFQLTTRALMRTAGGRLFVDVTPMLASPEGRDTLINVLGKSDPIIKGALTTILEHKDFIRPLSNDNSGKNDKPAQQPNYQALNDYNPPGGQENETLQRIVSDLISANLTWIEALKQNIQSKSGPDLFDFILEDIQQLKKASSDSQSFEVIMTGMNAASWINEKMFEWLGEKNAADTLSQSVANNITSEMGLALMNVADVIRPYQDVIDYLHFVKTDTARANFLDDLIKLKGGKEVQNAINTFLNKYGMRCAGEIDITKTRWSENPAALIPIILNNLRNFEPDASRQKFERGIEEALTKEHELINRLQQLPDGEPKASETKRMIRLVRNFAGYREFPKYGIVSRYFAYKQALMRESDRLVEAGVICEKEDIFYLSFEELKNVVRTRKVDPGIIEKRKEEYKIFEKLTPPRVMTSDGEIISGNYKRENLPEEAIVGLAVSAGVIEGRARIILNMENADLEEGDILVTTFTDPSWTPLFVSVKGLITEVGGLMTHGAVIAREYGLPAIVGVENATKLIKDGQQIRVNGTDGYVEIL